MKLLLSIAFVLAACGGSSKKDATPPPSNTEARGEAEVVEQPTDVHVITLADGDRAKAKQEIVAKCGERNYQVTQEGEEVIGDTTAWRIHYRCAK